MSSPPLPAGGVPTAPAAAAGAGRQAPGPVYRRYRTALLAAALILALAIWRLPLLLYGPQVEVHAMAPQALVRSVVASGHVEAPHRAAIGSQIVGSVRRVPVAEGQRVQAGQVLFELEDSELRAAAAQADASVASALARLRQLAEVQAPVAAQVSRQAQVTLANAQRQLARNEQLLQQGFIGPAAVEELRKDVDLAAAQHQAALAQAATVQPHGSDYAVALTALAQARANAEASASRLRYATIQAPAAGILIKRDVEVGDVVQPGKALITLSPDGQTQLVVQIDERNLGSLQVGQRAQASADAYAHRCFAAELVYINPGVDAQRGSVEVKLAVPQPPDYLRQDMTVSVDIVVQTREQALVVPLSAVQDADGGTPWILKAERGRLQRQDVALGLRSGGLAEVVRGLDAGDLVVPSGMVRTFGARARPVVVAAPPAAAPCRP